MVRRCKAYLTNINVVEAENELDKMSLECEPQTSCGNEQNLLRIYNSGNLMFQKF